MANVSQQSESVWPLPKFYFSVKIDEEELSFQEVSGLDMENEPLEYRAGNSPVFSKVKIPGTKKYSNITLKKGIFKGNTTFFKWFHQIKMNVIERKSMTISLLDEGNEPVMTWRLTDAFPVKISGTDLKAGSKEVAIEVLEVAHEGLKIEKS